MLLADIHIHKINIQYVFHCKAASWHQFLPSQLMILTLVLVVPPAWEVLLHHLRHLILVHHLVHLVLLAPDEGMTQHLPRLLNVEVSSPQEP